MKNSFFSRFTPKEPKFFPLLKQLSEVLCEASVVLTESLQHDSPTERADYYKKIKELEREGDKLTHRIFAEMSNGTYCRMKYAANLLLLFGSQLRFRWRLLDGCRPIANKVVLYIRKSALVLRLADRRHALIRNLICIAKHPAFPEI